MTYSSKLLPGWIRTAPATLLIALTLAACGTSYKVKHIEEVTSDTNAKGLFYYLPKTVIHVEAVVRETRKSYGPYFSGDVSLKTPIRVDDTKPLKTFSDVYHHNLANCDGEPPVSYIHIEDHFLPSQDPSYKFGDIVMSSEALPDPANFYRLEIDPETFASFSHTLKLDDNGIITGGKTTVEDSVTPLVFDLVKSGVAIAKLGLAGTEASEACRALLLSLDKKKSYENRLAALESERSKLLRAPMQNVDADRLNLVLKDLDGKIAKLKKDNEALLALFSASDDANDFVVIWSLEPATEKKKYKKNPEGTYAVKYEPGKDDEKKKRISYIQGTAAKVLTSVKTNDELKKFLSEIRFHITPDREIDQTITANRNSLSDGYRYRIPMRATIKLLSASDEEIASARLTVAQFGLLAALPSKFNGSKGELGLSFNASTGGLTSAMVGATPVSSSLPSDAAGLYTDYRKASDEARDEEEQAAKEKAENEDRAELDEMLSQIELLEAEVKLRELREKLGLNEDG